MIGRDGTHTSLWQDTTAHSIENETASSQKVDVIIVGAGITGISTALMLQKAGKRCMVLEAQNIGFGTTGGTTAHINTLLDTPYKTIIKNFGQEKANLVARAAEEAVACIRENVSTYEINCGFENCKAFLFAQDENQDKELQSIKTACIDVGLLVAEEAAIPVPRHFTRTMSIVGQAKFHPLRYIEGLAKDFIYLGGILLEHSRVIHVAEEGDILTVQTDSKTFQCDQIIYATHVPPGINLIHLRYISLRSYAIAVTLASGDYPKDLAYDMYDPYHYYRTQEIDGQAYLIVGGEDHKTGDDTNTEACFNKLESHIRKHFDVKEVTHRWSSQYYESMDGLPYIGVMPGKSDKILVATGFGGNGMTYGTIAAKVLKSIVLKEDNPLIELFSPSRIKLVAGFKNFVEHNVDVLKEFFGNLFSSEELGVLAGVAPEEGKVIQIDNKKVGIYKDHLGAVHAVSATCTHMGCTVCWNQSEKSWDCPCHGARYAVDGSVLNGPADKNLEYLNVELLETKKS